MVQQPRNVLIAIDGSEHSFKAVQYTGRMLPPADTRVTLLHIVDHLPGSFWGPETQDEFHRMVLGADAWDSLGKERIRDFATRAGEVLIDLGYREAELSLVVQERRAGVARDIAAEAERGYDALVLGRRGLSRLKDLIFGSVANKLINRMTRVPLWVVGDHVDASRILIAMDESEGAMRALEFVGRMLGDHHPELLLLHVVFELDAHGASHVRPFIADEKMAFWLQQIRLKLDASRGEMGRIFRDAVRRLEEQGFDPGRIHTSVVNELSSRAGAIVEEARAGGYGTVVLGRRGLTRVEEFYMGRVSNKVLQLAKDMTVWIVS